jgi:hypothetical protein
MKTRLALITAGFSVLCFYRPTVFEADDKVERVGWGHSIFHTWF